jgi:hypothetical protein
MKIPLCSKYGLGMFPAVFSIHSFGLKLTQFSLMAEVMALYRKGKIAAIEPLKVFDISELKDAFRHFSLKNRMGKVAISLEDGNSMINVRESRMTYWSN